MTPLHHAIPFPTISSPSPPPQPSPPLPSTSTPPASPTPPCSLNNQLSSPSPPVTLLGPLLVSTPYPRHHHTTLQHHVTPLALLVVYKLQTSSSYEHHINLFYPPYRHPAHHTTCTLASLINTPAILMTPDNTTYAIAPPHIPLHSPFLSQHPPSIHSNPVPFGVSCYLVLRL